MATDIAAMKRKLNQLATGNSPASSLIKLQEGENKLRLVPLQANPSNPFLELYFYYLDGRTILSPYSFGKKDPIREFGIELRSQGKLPIDQWNETKKYFPKLRTLVPVVIRGKESDGVKFWSFGKTVQEKLLAYITDEDYGDIVDPQTGRDIKVIYSIPKIKTTGSFPESEIIVVPKQTPLTTDPVLLKRLLTEQPNILDIYDLPSVDQLNTLLERLVKDEIPDESPSSTPVAESEPTPINVVAVEEASKEFDKVFSDDN